MTGSALLEDIKVMVIHFNASTSSHIVQRDIERHLFLRRFPLDNKLNFPLTPALSVLFPPSASLETIN